MLSFMLAVLVTELFHLHFVLILAFAVLFAALFTTLLHLHFVLILAFATFLKESLHFHRLLMCTWNFRSIQLANGCQCFRCDAMCLCSLYPLLSEEKSVQRLSGLCIMIHFLTLQLVSSFGSCFLCVVPPSFRGIIFRGLNPSLFKIEIGLKIGLFQIEGRQK